VVRAMKLGSVEAEPPRHRGIRRGGGPKDFLMPPFARPAFLTPPSHVAAEPWPRQNARQAKAVASAKPPMTTIRKNALTTTTRNRQTLVGVLSSFMAASAWESHAFPGQGSMLGVPSGAEAQLSRRSL
jgi:hypothetical protein